ncbi:MAG: hypothetical protein WBB37_01605 [bacterium]
MKKFIAVIMFIAAITILYISTKKTTFSPGDLSLSFTTSILDEENKCFNRSYEQIHDSLLEAWNSVFTISGIENNPFAMMLYFIRYFNALEQNDNTRCFSFQEIISSDNTNVISSAIATCAIMQKMGWDFQFFYNENEYYLGINFTEDWQIRKGNWVERNGKSYFLKEFDYITPVGELKSDNPAKTYKCLIARSKDLHPIPLINSLPVFSGFNYEKSLVWFYKGRRYSLTAWIPEEQAQWTVNLPVSLHGTVASGIFEFDNIGIIGNLEYLIKDYDEYDKVNFLFKLSQSESIFVYDNKKPIKSITNQLIEGQNDCDGRSIFLYCLLNIVLDYDSNGMVFINWENHLAIGLKPQTRTAKEMLEKEKAGSVDGDYYVLDAAYIGDTHWGSMMKRLSDEYEIIR